MSTIHFVGGEKGGVGKSVVSRVLSQYFLEYGLLYAGFDADQSHATLTHYYPEFTQPIVLDDFESIDQIVEIATDEEQKQLLIDLPSQSQRFLDRWLEDSGVLEMCEELGLKTVFWYVVDGGRDSISLLEEFQQKYGNVMPFVVVKNHGRGNDFSDIDAVLAKGRAARLLGVVDIPELHTATLHRIDKLSLGFWSAINVKSSNGAHLSLMERQRTKVWLRKAFDSIGAVFRSI
ncbi:MAG: mobilization protein [Halopseudomonas sabulinigri]